MKAELVADSVEAKPFPYKAKNHEETKRSHQEKHLQQCSKAFISCPPSNPSAKPAEETHQARMTSDIEEKTRRAKRTIENR